MKQTLSPQSMAIYQQLSKSQQMTAKDLGARLGIFPQAAYRAIKPLQELGIVEESGRYPRKYRAKTSEDSFETYMKLMQEQYLKTFFIKSQKNKSSLTQLMKVEFMHGRENFLQKELEALQNAKHKIDYIVSGEEVPAETVLARKEALARGVKLRFIVQQVDEFKRYMFDNWKKLGLQVKYYPILEARIVIVDSKIAYFTSYNPKINNEAIGVWFDYAPIAKLMQELFEKRWKQAKEI